MDARLLDVVIGLAAFLILCVLLVFLPTAMAAISIPAAYAYLTAIIVFILFLSGAGYLVNDKIT
jgi:uncharacterized membrane protein